MSGEAGPLPCPTIDDRALPHGLDFYELGRAEERRDVLAFLNRRLAACETMAARNADEAERAGVMKRQLLVLIDELRAGMHEHEAGLPARENSPKEEV